MKEIQGKMRKFCENEGHFGQNENSCKKIRGDNN